jgi:signal peptidase I
MGNPGPIDDARASGRELHWRWKAAAEPAARRGSLMRSILFGRHPRRTAVRVVVLAATAAVVFGVVLLPVRLSGISMEPTYDDGALNFANRLAFAWRRPARGDVVAIRMAGLRVLYVKRIIGLPGERVEIAMGTVLIDGQPLVEPTVVRRAAWNVPPVKLGLNEYFVVGDNRAMAAHNHDFGRTTRDRIVGTMLF